MAFECSWRSLCNSAIAWNTTTTILSAFFLALGTVLLTQECFVPSTNTLKSACASQATVLFADYWVLVVLIACCAFILIVIHQILVVSGLTCDGVCKNKRHVVVLSGVTAICAAIYADFVDHTLKEIPTTAIQQPDTCFVCPDGTDPTNLAALWIGVVCAFAGFVVSLVLVCSNNGRRDDGVDIMTEQFVKQAAAKRQQDYADNEASA